MNQFLTDVLKGLQSDPKYLDSKYFYDKKGDELFQKIMDSDEYYLTNAEMEIFSTQQAGIADEVLKNIAQLDVTRIWPGRCYQVYSFIKRTGRTQGHSQLFSN